MADIRLFRLRSILLSRSDGEKGHYEYEEFVDEFIFSQHPDKRGLVNRLIAEALAGACKNTGLPPSEGIWKVTLGKRTANNLNLPREMKF